MNQAKKKYIVLALFRRLSEEDMECLAGPSGLFPICSPSLLPVSITSDCQSGEGMTRRFESRFYNDLFLHSGNFWRR